MASILIVKKNGQSLDFQTYLIISPIFVITRVIDIYTVLWIELYSQFVLLSNLKKLIFENEYFLKILFSF